MQAFAGYMLLEKLGQGGMNHVFRARRAEATPDEPDVVVKSLISSLNGTPSVQLFQHEAHVCMSLNHPNVIGGLEAGEFQKRHYMVLEYVDGPDVATLLHVAREAGLRISIALSVYIAISALRGLDHAHHLVDGNGDFLGLIHRDVSPDNVFTTLSGGVKLGDFGIAKLARVQQFTDPAFGIRGKLTYLPPERMRGEPFDARADQFSAALVLYEMITGQKAYHSERLELDVELVKRVRDAVIVNPRKVVSEIPRSLETVMLKALEANPKNRFKTCAEFAQALQTVAEKDLLLSGPEDLRAVLEELFPQRYQR